MAGPQADALEAGEDWRRGEGNGAAGQRRFVAVDQVDECSNDGY